MIMPGTNTPLSATGSRPTSRCRWPSHADPESDGLRRRAAWVIWNGPRRFVLRESHLFQPSDPGFARMLGAWGKRDEGTGMIEFSAEADCVMLPGNRYRIVDLRVGKFGE